VTQVFSSGSRANEQSSPGLALWEKAVLLLLLAIVGWPLLALFGLYNGFSGFSTGPSSQGITVELGTCWAFLWGAFAIVLPRGQRRHAGVAAAAGFATQALILFFPRVFFVRGLLGSLLPGVVVASCVFFIQRRRTTGICC